jgi:hypothetical protein
MLNIIIIIVVTFAFTIWPIKKAAEWLGAEKTSYGSVIFALVLTFIFGIGGVLLSIPLAFAGIAGWILIVVLMFFLTGKAYSIALQTPFWNGIGIAIVAAVIGALLQVIFSLVFGISIFPSQDKYEGEVTLAVIEDAAENICKCGIDSLCLQQSLEEWARVMEAGKDKDFSDKERKTISIYYKRAMTCWQNPKEYVPPKKKKSKKKVTKEPIPETPEPNAQNNATVEKNEKVPLSEATETSPKTKSIATKEESAPPEPKPVYGWKDADLNNLQQLINKNVQVETTRGSVRKGRLTEINDGVITIQKSRSLSYPVPISEIKKMKVYVQIK